MKLEIVNKIWNYAKSDFGTQLYDIKKVTGWSDTLINSLSWVIGEM